MSTEKGSLKTASKVSSRAPAPGEAAARSPQTEQAYLDRALWFEAHTARHLGIAEPTPLEVAAYALERRGEWSKSTWRQVKAALAYRYECMGTSAALQASELLRNGAQTDCLAKTLRTSARRDKAVNPKSMNAVIGAIRASRSRYAALLETWLILGAELGLRPHEWSQAQLIHATPQEIGDVEASTEEGIDPDLELPYLRIANAKTSNGRGHGEYRHLSLYRVRPALVETAGEFAAQMTQMRLDGHYELCYEACRRLLSRINSSIHGDKPSKWVQLYSPRHKFSAEAKKELGQDGVAALMGHATTKTATEHYGRRMSSTGSLGPRPIAAEVIRVRKIRSSKAGRAGMAAGAGAAPKAVEPLQGAGE